jgi:hypothetical protein
LIELGTLGFYGQLFAEAGIHDDRRSLFYQQQSNYRSNRIAGQNSRTRGVVQKYTAKIVATLTAKKERNKRRYYKSNWRRGWHTEEELALTARVKARKGNRQEEEKAGQVDGAKQCTACGRCWT